MPLMSYLWSVQWTLVEDYDHKLILYLTPHLNESPYSKIGQANPHAPLVLPYNQRSFNLGIIQNNLQISKINIYIKWHSVVPQ